MTDEELIEQMREAVMTHYDAGTQYVCSGEYPAVNDACLLLLAAMVRKHDFAKMDVISAEQHDNEVRADERARLKAEMVKSIDNVHNPC